MAVKQNSIGDDPLIEADSSWTTEKFSVFLYLIETRETHILEVAVDMTFSQLFAASMTKFGLPANGEATLHVNGRPALTNNDSKLLLAKLGM